MTTNLTIPISNEILTSSQEVVYVKLDITNKQLSYKVIDFDSDENKVGEQEYIVNFADIPAGNAKDNFIATYTSIVNYARSQGQIGDGTDINPLI